MKILYVTQQFSPVIGGTENVFKKYYDYFNKNHEVKVITTNLKYYKPSSDLLKIKDYISRVPIIPNQKSKINKLYYWHLFKRFYGPTMELDFNFPKRFMQEIKKTDFDILHASAAEHATTFYAAKTAKKLNKPFVLTPALHLHSKDKNYSLKNRINSIGQPDIKLKNLKMADYIFTYTNAEKNKCVDMGMNKNNCFVTSIGINPNNYPVNNLDSLRQKINYIPADKILLFIGRRNKYKGLQHLIDSLEYIDKNIKLLIIGPKVDKIRIKENTKNRIFDLGIASENEKKQAIELCDIFCLPSTRESFGIVYLEAWMYEKPVIACDIPTSRELINDNKDGFLVKQNPADIAEKIKLLLKDNNLCLNMGRCGYNKTLKNYTWGKIMPGIEGIYKNIYE